MAELNRRALWFIRYCEDCRVEHGWPASFSEETGLCFRCGKQNVRCHKQPGQYEKYTTETGEEKWRSVPAMRQLRKM